ncbi:RxLR effector candidate protein [Phytophthora palmivora]|uniref:RxLR effector candidate protein n=1 Tax=Phytophthora palmivora TaxID=4796 RepID=A0A2P4YVE3_9STRA|nr:RxLR effector candidate protein [Phytophthora palmivora]
MAKPLNQLLHRFGEISGLNVQPKKSVLIPLNTAWKQSRCHGYAVLGTGETTRILGYHCGTHDRSAYNWELRIMNIKLRSQVATRVANSIKQRVVLLTRLCCRRFYSLDCTYRYRRRLCNTLYICKSDSSGKEQQLRLERDTSSLLGWFSH